MHVLPVLQVKKEASLTTCMTCTTCMTFSVNFLPYFVHNFYGFLTRNPVKNPYICRIN